MSVTPGGSRLVAALAVSWALLVLSSEVRAELLPAGEFVEEAVAIDLHAELFSFLVDEVMEAIPPSLVVGSTPPEEVINLLLCSQDFWLENLIIHTDFQVASLQSLDDGLRLVLDFDLWVNGPGSPAWIVLDGCLDDACALWMEPANVHVEVPLALQLATDADGSPFVDVVFGAVQQDVSAAVSTQLRLGSCALTTLNAWWYENTGENLFETLVAEAIAAIDTTIESKLEEVEVDLEEALAALWMGGSTELLELPIVYEVRPTAVEHSQAGVRLVLGGRVDVERDDCTNELDPGGSLWTPGPLPTHFSSSWHLRSLLGDELLNSALYGIWRGGALCFEADELGGAPLTGELLGLLLGEIFQQELERLAPGAGTPLMIRTVPWEIPVVRYDGAHDILVEIRDLDIEFYAELLGRMSRITALRLDIVVGIDLELADDGALQLSVAMLSEEFSPTVTYDELSAPIGEALLDNFDSILEVAIGAIAGDALGEEPTRIALPTLSGLGLATLHVEPEGTQLDFLAGSFGIGPSTGGTSSGCEGDEGCSAEDSGCAGEDGGCSTEGGGCAEEEGGCAGGEGGCSAEDIVTSGGCSAVPSDHPSDTGCSGDLIQAACGAAGRALRPSTPGMLLVTCLLLATRRRRRSR